MTRTNGALGTTKAPARPASRSRSSPDLVVLVGMGSLLALLAVAIVAALLLIVDVNNDAVRLTDRDVQYTTAISAAALNAKAIANDERGFLLSGNTEFIDQLDVRTGNARAAFAVAASVADTDAQHDAVIEANAGFERWVSALRAETAAFQAGDREEAVAGSLGPTRALRKTYERSLGQAQSLGADSIEATSRSVSDASRRSIVILVAYLVIALAIGVFVTIWVLRTAVRPTRALPQSGAGGDRLHER